EYFGAARPPKELLIHQRLANELDTYTPGNADINFAVGITLNVLDNRFANTKLDGFGGIFTIPDGLDTSMPMVFESLWYADTNNAGNVELEIDAAQIETGDLLDGSTAVVNYPVVEVVTASTRYKSMKTTFNIDVSSLVPGDSLAYRFFRDARAGNAHDTLVGNIIIAKTRATGTFWR
ncbi:MAG: hypothetical protein GY869_09420, partial [Planctomycetes bacterium]|nr:hypothetical protein [Planctomycetota bacterium]